MYVCKCESVCKSNIKIQTYVNKTHLDGRTSASPERTAAAANTTSALQQHMNICQHSVIMMKVL